MDQSPVTTESPESPSRISRGALWLESFLYVEIALALLLLIVELKVMNIAAIECDAQNGKNTIGDLFGRIGIGLAVTGVVTYLLGLSFPRPRRRIHVAFVLLLIFVALGLVFLHLWAFGNAMSETDYCS